MKGMSTAEDETGVDKAVRNLGRERMVTEWEKRRQEE